MGFDVGRVADVWGGIDHDDAISAQLHPGCDLRGFVLFPRLSTGQAMEEEAVKECCRVCECFRPLYFGAEKGHCRADPDADVIEESHGLTVRLRGGKRLFPVVEQEYWCEKFWPGEAADHD